MSIIIANVFAVATSEWYTINPSTSTPSSPSINKAVVRIRDMKIVQSGTTAQTLTFYVNATSSTTATAVNTVNVPAVAGVYSVFENLGDIDNVTMNYFAVKSSTSTDPAQVQVLVR